MTITTISVAEETKNRLASYGQFSETWDELINKVLDTLEEKKRRN